MPFFSEISIFSRTSEEWSKLLYDDREMCSIPAPMYSTIGFLVSHLFSSPIYFTTFYALYFESSPSFKGYKRYLGVHAVSNFLFEVFMSTALKPVLYLPYRTTRFAGVLFFKYLNGAILVFIFLLICISTFVSIMEMIHYRFKLIVEISLSEQWIQQWVKFIKYWRIALLFHASLVAISYGMCGGTQFDQPELKLTLGTKFLETYPEIMCSSALVLPIGSIYELKPIVVFNMVTFLGTLSGFFICSCMSAVLLVSMQKLMKTCSPKTIQMHRKLLYSIFVQISVHGIMLGFPIVIYIIAMVFNFDGNEIGYVALIIASLHGAMSTLAMLIFNRPLYQTVVDRLKKLLNISSVPMGTINVASSDSSQRSTSTFK